MRLPLDKKTPPKLSGSKHIGCVDYPIELERIMRRLWDIDIATGKIHSLQRPSVIVHGARDVHGHLFLRLRIDAQKHTKIRISRLVWRAAKGYWPNFPLKHIDGDITNNSIHNLDRAEDGYQQRKYTGDRPSRAA